MGNVVYNSNTDRKNGRTEDGKAMNAAGFRSRGVGTSGDSLASSAFAVLKTLYSVHL